MPQHSEEKFEGNAVQSADVSNTADRREAIVEQFLTVQAQEAEVKLRELQVREAEIACQKEDQIHNKEIAEKSISAQLEDARLKQNYFLEVNRSRFWLVIVITVVFLAFLLASMFMGKEAFVGRLFDTLIGALGGFAISKVLESKKKDN